MFDMVVGQMEGREGVTEQRKEENQMEWVCRMENIQGKATEIINHELIFGRIDE